MILQVQALNKSFGDKAVIRNFSYAFPDRGIVLLQGPSGSGKTTLLRLVAGLEKPDSGSVVIPPPVRLSMVFQEDRLLPTLDVRGNILAVLGAKTPGNIAVADECLRRCGLAGEEKRVPSELSGGMRRRVALARAIAYGGSLLLLDEPFKGLDKALKRQVMDFVFERKDRLTLLVTHDPEESAQADSVLEAGAWAGR